MSGGTTQIDLIVTDGHDGLLAAITDPFPATLQTGVVVGCFGVFLTPKH